MLAEIITIGDELLIGQVVDTNSAWIGQQLSLAGIAVKQITSVSDQKEHILAALHAAGTRASLILITGGLGPTKDDITKNTLCEFFGTQLVFNKTVYKHVESLFHSLGKEVTPINKLQAEVPANCVPLINKMGTAPGMWFEHKKIIYVSMPGVPYEMKGLMKDEVLPRLAKKFKLPFIVHKTVLTQGIGESFLATKIEKWENSLAKLKIKLAYLPSPGIVRLRLSTTGAKKNELNENVDKKIKQLLPLISEYYFGMEEFGKEKESFAAAIGKLLNLKNATLSTAESCTGGYIAHLITSVPGSSTYYVGSVIAYSNEVKERELNVSKNILDSEGAVSRAVAEAMANGARKKFKTTYSISVSGIAGPDGGTKDKPVGTVWIAVASEKGIVSEKFQFGNNRERNIIKSANAALNMLRKISMEGS